MIVPWVGQRRMLNILRGIWAGNYPLVFPLLQAPRLYVYSNNVYPADDDAADGSKYTKYGLSSTSLDSWDGAYTSADRDDGLYRSKIDHPCRALGWILEPIPLSGAYGIVVMQSAENFAPYVLLWAQRHPNVPFVFAADVDYVTIVPQVGLRSEL